MKFANVCLFGGSLLRVPSYPEGSTNTWPSSISISQVVLGYMHSLRRRQLHFIDPELKENRHRMDCRERTTNCRFSYEPQCWKSIQSRTVILWLVSCLANAVLMVSRLHGIQSSKCTIYSIRTHDFCSPHDSGGYAIQLG